VLRDAWRAVVILLKGAGILAAGLVILVILGVIWLSLNPPFRSPETGELHASASRDVTIGASQATLAIQLEAKINENAFPTTNDQPGPPALSARIIPTETGSVEGVRLILAPGDATSPASVVRETAPGRLDWTMSCLEGPRRPCRLQVVLLVEAKPSATDRKLRLMVEGDLRYPIYTPTPGWSSFDLDLRSVGPEMGTGPNPVADASGTVGLAVTQPVIAVPLHVEYGAAPPADQGAPPAALRLALETVRLTETAPAGLDAPEPVRATVFAADGTVMARMGVRPGDAPTLTVALGRCATGCVTDYRIAFEWMDRRPEADYRLTWRAEIIGLPADDRGAVAVAMGAGDAEVAELAGTTLAPGPDHGPLRAQRLDVEVHGLPTVGVPPTSVHVQMLITATVDPAIEIGTGVVSIQPFAISGPGLGVPFDVEPGQTGAIVLNLEDGCTASRCDQWAFQSSIPIPPDPVAGASPSDVLDVTWQLEVRAWRLLPDAAPITLSLDVR
jgi:hypothetical protein